jgi:hypothetical protein
MPQIPAIALRIDPTPRGMRITDLRIGLTFEVPDAVTVLPGTRGVEGALVYDIALRCYTQPIELRMRLDALAMPPSPQNAGMQCLVYAKNRTASEPQVGLAQPQQLQDWQVDAAASAIYPLRAPEDGFDYEECFYAQRASAGCQLVLTKRFATSRLTPQVWADFNTKLNATLGWGVQREPPAAVASFFVDGGMNLTSGAAGYADQLAGELSAARVPRAEVESASTGLGRVVYGSDAPDERVNPELIPLLDLTAFGNVVSPLFRERLASMIAQRVVTYRDLRGLHMMLERVVAAMP